VAGFDLQSGAPLPFSPLILPLLPEAPWPPSHVWLCPHKATGMRPRATGKPCRTLCGFKGPVRWGYTNVLIQHCESQSCATNTLLHYEQESQTLKSLLTDSLLYYSPLVFEGSFS